MNKFLSLLFVVLVGLTTNAQVIIGGAGPITPGAMLEILSGGNKGLMLPKVADVNDVANVEGMMVYDQTIGCPRIFTDGAWSGCLDVPPNAQIKYPYSLIGGGCVLNVSSLTIGGANVPLPKAGLSFASSNMGIFTVNSTTGQITSAATSGSATLTVNDNGILSTIPIDVFPKSVIFTSSGTYTFQSSGIPNFDVEAYGGGGGGNRANFDINRRAGGGGAYLKRNYTITSPSRGKVITFTVGQGGAGAARANAGASGYDGGDTTIDFVGYSTSTANGGQAGLEGGGGGSGGIPINFDSGSNGGSGGGQDPGVGGTGGNGNGYRPGAGGGNGDTDGDNGADGTIAGGGGGGGASGAFLASTRASGGDGARGEVKFTFACPPSS